LACISNSYYVLIGSSKACVFSSQYREYNISLDCYLRILDELFEFYPPSVVYYMAAVHHSSQENILANSSQQNFTNNILPSYLIEKLRGSEGVFFVYASSSLIFSHSDTCIQNESTPRSPSCSYSCSKVTIEELLAKYNNDHSLDSLTAIFYNHESVRRTSRFFSKKVIKFASQISKSGKSSTLNLINPNATIDMGYAVEYMSLLIELVSRRLTGSFIFSTSRLITVQQFAQ
jgi:GDPmannose 4,6-dehydratase